MTPPYVKRILDAAKLATKGPWVTRQDRSGCGVDAKNGFHITQTCIAPGPGEETSEGNATFIATTRTDAPKCARALEVAIHYLDLIESEPENPMNVQDNARTALAKISKLEAE